MEGVSFEQMRENYQHTVRETCTSRCPRRAFQESTNKRHEDVRISKGGRQIISNKVIFYHLNSQSAITPCNRENIDKQTLSFGVRWA